MMRACGGCTLCCKLLPVKGVQKPANQRCPHQRTGKGCAVYKKPGAFPGECSLWTCRWLINDDADDLARPDRSHYVIDVIPDAIAITNNETGAVIDVAVFQVWCDPGYPMAYRDPALRAWLEHKKMPALVRLSDTGVAAVLFPASWSSDGRWHEKSDQINMGGQGQDMDRVARALEADARV